MSAAVRSSIAAALSRLDGDGSGTIAVASFGRLLECLGLAEQDTHALLASLPPEARRPSGGLCVRAVVDRLFGAPGGPLHGGKGVCEREPEEESSPGAKVEVVGEPPHSPNGRVQTWSFEDWFGSLNFPAALAGCVAGHLCTAGHDDKFVLAHIKTMRDRGDKRALQELLHSCEALDVLVDILWSGAEDLAMACATPCAEVSDKLLLSRDLRCIGFGWPGREANTSVTDEAVRRLVQGCRGLQKVEFTKCDGLGDDAVRHLASNCSALLEVVFTDCPRLTDSAARHLAAGCKDLQRVSFGCPGGGVTPHITDEAARHLAEACRGLRRVDFTGCAALTDAGVGRLATGCPGLREAVFTDCPRLTDSAAAHLAEGCKDLRYVSLGCPRGDANWRLTDEAVRRLAEGCRGLRRVDLACCKCLTDAAARHLAANCPGLQEAVFTDCWHLTDAAAAHLAEGCKELQHVGLGCPRGGSNFSVTDEAVRRLAEGCAGLERVDLRFCRSLTDRALELLAERCQGLRRADFRGCGRVTGSAAARLGAALPGCEVLSGG